MSENYHEFLDLSPDLEKEHLRDTASAMEFAVNSPYDLTVLFGDERVEGLEWYGKGIQVAMDSLAGGYRMSGSAITEGPLGVNARRRRDKLLANSISPFSQIVEDYYSGKVKPEDCSPEIYLGIQVLLGMQGPNIDIKGWSRSDDTNKTTDHMYNLMCIGYSLYYDGQKRTISKITTQRHSYIHMVDNHIPANGGINLLNFPKDKTSNPWDEMTSIRKEQQAEMRLSDDNSHWILENHLNPEGKRKMEMSGELKNLGQWCHHVARSIRTSTNSNLDVSLENDSYLNRHPWEKEIGFEDAIGTVTNLMTAFFAKPKETITLIEELGLDKVLPEWDTNLAQELAYRMNQFKEVEREAYIHNQKRNWNDGRKDQYPKTLEKVLKIEDLQKQPWEEALSTVDTYLSQKKLITEISDFGRGYAITQLKTFAPLFTLFSPVAADKFIKLVPDPNKRDKVEGSFSYGSLSPEEKKKRMFATITSLEEIAADMQIAQDTRAEEVWSTARILRKAYLRE